MSDVHLRESTTTAPRRKPAPKTSAIPVPFTYNASDDGTDENLLILLHGLGDTNIPFGKLGRTLRLPQTATLALRAPDQIPFLDEPAFQWYASFDPLGELLERPDPTRALELLDGVLTHLTRECGWPPGRVHLFGFAQGGGLAAEAALRWWRAHREGGESAALASVVSVGGPLLSYSTLSARCPTPVLLFHRANMLPASALAAFRKGFGAVTDVKMTGGEGMPRSRDEWEPIMRFWSERLAKRPMEGLYEVMTGVAPAP